MAFLQIVELPDHNTVQEPAQPVDEGYAVTDVVNIPAKHKMKDRKVCMYIRNYCIYCTWMHCVCCIYLLCVCMYVCIHLYVRIHVYVATCICVFVFICVYVYAYMRTYVNIYAYTLYLCLYTYVLCMYTCLCSCMYICVFVLNSAGTNVCFPHLNILYI